MAVREHPQSRYGPIGLTSSDGFPWTRLVTGVFAVAISLAMSWRVGEAPVELAPAEAPQPKTEQAATAEPLDRQEPEIVEATARETLSQPDASAQLAPTPAMRPPASPKRPPLQRTTTHAKVQSNLVAHSKTGVRPRSIDSKIAHSKLNPTRSDVRNEYIAAREQVAAFTSEDSGSAYLTRLAAGQSAAQTNPAGHTRNKSQPSRRAPVRS